eukprot:8748983-Pyramimonas_sp.AAC.1
MGYKIACLATRKRMGYPAPLQIFWHCAILAVRVDPLAAGAAPLGVAVYPRQSRSRAVALKYLGHR